VRTGHLPLRLTTGAVIPNSGLSKRAFPPGAAAGLQNMAANAVSVVRTMRPGTFDKTFSAAELTLGVALLTPVVPSALVGPRWPRSAVDCRPCTGRPRACTNRARSVPPLRPTQDGTAVAKGVWMFGTGTALLADSLAAGAHRRRFGTETGARAHRRSSRTPEPLDRQPGADGRCPTVLGRRPPAPTRARTTAPGADPHPGR